MDVGSFLTIAEGLIPILKKLRRKKAWKGMIVKIGDSILNQEHDLESEIFSQLEALFSNEHLKKLSKSTINTSGYDMEELIKVRLDGFFEGCKVEEESRNRYIEDFLEVLRNEIKGKYPNIFNQIYLKDFRNESYANQKELLRNQDKLIEVQNNVNKKLNKLTDIRKLYMKIEQVDDWLKENTKPSISLNFFDYEENQFVDEFKRSLSENEIYIQGKTREEVVYYVLVILKNTCDENIMANICVVNSLNDWNDLKGTLKNSILIPNFNASEIPIIPGNKNIIIFGEEDFTGNRNPIILKNRIRTNMYEKLKNEGVEIDLANDIVNKSNGLFSVFKRHVFQGKASKPSWEKQKGRLFIPALLLGKWTAKDGDREVLSEISQMEYNEYMQSINSIIGGEDPFILKMKSLNNTTVYNIANVEEAWEILFNDILETDINIFKAIIPKVILSIDPIFELHPSQHFYASLNADKPRYSLELKSGIIRSLIMLVNVGNKNNNCNITYMQHFVDSIMGEVFRNITSAKEWFGISQLLGDMVEASPETVTSIMENEVDNEKSPFWDLFEKKDDSFTGRNYYTHILWAIEKLLCMEEYVPRAVMILAKLAEREIQYSISNKPIGTLSQALCAWVHEINIKIKEKIQLTEKIVSDYKIGWELLEQLLPTRAPGGTFMSMSKPKYRLFRFVEELEFQSQIYDTYKEYVKIAIKYADDDLSKWAVIFEDCLFFEFGSENEVFDSISKVISNCSSDKEKFKFKEQVRSTIYKHRFHKNATWAMKKEYVDKLETEVFNKIDFSNKMYNYLYLFNSYEPAVINPEPFSDDYDHDKQKVAITELQINAINVLSENKNFSIIDFINEIKEEAHGEIGVVIAEKVHNYEQDIDFIIKVVELNKIRIVKSYIYSIYCKKGNSVIKEVLLDERIKSIPADIKSEILSVATINEELLFFIETLDEDVKRIFWKNIWVRGKSTDKQILNQILDKMIEYYNYGNALDIIIHENSFSAERHLDILEKILINQEKYTLGGNDQYKIIESFNIIYKECYPGKKEKDRIISLEIGYIKVLSKAMEMKYLKFALRNEPEFFTELIRSAYKSSEDIETVLSSKEQQKAKVAFEILYNVKFCPGMNDDGTLEFEKINNWVGAYLKLIDENHQSKIGRQILGNCLVYSPLGYDGIFPHEAVRKIIEMYYSKDLKTGFHIEINNKRGVYWGTNGEEEKRISKEYLKYANAIKISSPRTSEILLAISKDYHRQSEQERERAENGF